MRWLLAVMVVAVVFGCTEHGKGGVFCSPDALPTNTGCNICGCDIEGNVHCTELPCVEAGLPDAANACSPEGNCPNGPICEFACCGIGEQCVGGVCTCAGNAACTGGDTCQSGGPVMGGGFCGNVCCGSAAHPCPI